MIIGHVITGLWGGGAEAALFRLCTATSGAHEHFVISLMAGGEYVERLAAAGVEVFSLDMPRGRVTVGGLVRCARVLRTKRPDIVQTWMYHADLIGGLVARLSGFRHVIWNVRHASVDPALHSRSTSRVIRACGVLSARLPIKIVSCSNAAISVHERAGYDARRFVVIPNGYPLAALGPSPELREQLRDRLGIDRHQFVLGMAARHHPLKDHGTLFRALRSLTRSFPTLLCLLAGHGVTNDNVELRAALRAHGIERNVCLLGQVSDIRPLMCSLDLHVLSSISESFPNVVAEAMACETPCVTTSVGDAAAIVGEAGWVVEPGSSQRLAEAIEQALTVRRCDPEAWEALRIRCGQRIREHFSIELMVRRYETLWQSVALAG